jgi:hypothetical protein
VFLPGYLKAILLVTPYICKMEIGKRPTIKEHVILLAEILMADEALKTVTRKIENKWH